MVRHCVTPQHLAQHQTVQCTAGRGHSNGLYGVFHTDLPRTKNIFTDDFNLDYRFNENKHQVSRCFYIVHFFTHGQENSIVDKKVGKTDRGLAL